MLFLVLKNVIKRFVWIHTMNIPESLSGRQYNDTERPLHRAAFV